MTDINEIENMEKPFYTLYDDKKSDIALLHSFVLKDGRIIIFSEKLITIYNKNNLNAIDVKKENNPFILGKLEIKDGIIIDSYFNIIKIKGNDIELLKNPDKIKDSRRLFLLPNGLIASTFLYYWVEFYIFNESEDKIEFKDKINTNITDIINICGINEKEIMVYGGPTFTERYLKFFNINNKQLILIIKHQSHINSIPILLNKNKIIIGNKGKFDIINLKSHFFSKSIGYGNRYILVCFLKLNDKTLIGGDNVGNIYIFNIEKKNFNLINIFKAHDDLILDIFKYTSNKILSIGREGTIKVFEIQNV